MSQPPVYFYLPPEDTPGELPESTGVGWRAFQRGVHIWTLQTYLNLAHHGFDCRLVDHLPDRGVVLAHRDSLPDRLRPGPGQLLVCFYADRRRHPFAQVHIVQNPAGLGQPAPAAIKRLLLGDTRYAMPHWPQPGLLPRRPQRRDRFDTLAFVGAEKNLAPELRDPGWTKTMNELGIAWRIVYQPNAWNDYRDIDGVLSVRSFAHTGFTNKPASKLYNAWHAGVPAILGVESAYRAQRRSDLDYLEADSLDAARHAVRRLRQDPDLRRRMIDRGLTRANETDRARLTEAWIDLIETRLRPALHRWAGSALHRQRFHLARQATAAL